MDRLIQNRTHHDFFPVESLAIQQSYRLYLS